MFLKKLFVLFLVMCLLPIIAINANAAIGDACDISQNILCSGGEVCSGSPGTCQAGGMYCGDGSCNNGETATSCPSDCGGGSSQPCGNLGGACCQTGYTSTGTPVSGASDCPGYCYSGGSCTANTADPCPSDACSGTCCSTGTDPCPNDVCPNICCTTTACTNWATLGQGCNPLTGTCCSGGSCSNTAGPGTCQGASTTACNYDSVCGYGESAGSCSDCVGGVTTDPCPSDACPNVCCGTTGTCASSPANCFSQTECTTAGYKWCSGVMGWPPCYPTSYVCPTTPGVAICESIFDGCCKPGAESYDPDCGTMTSFCGNGRCEGSEDKMKCPMDCGFSGGYCGDGFCNGAETATSCHDDCNPYAKVGCPGDPMLVRDKMKCNECDYMWCDNMYFDTNSFGSPCFPRGSMCPSSSISGMSCAPGTVCIQPKNMLALREKFGASCPTADELLKHQEKCREGSGRTVREMDPMGCEYMRCEFSSAFEDKYDMEKKFMMQTECPPMSEIDKMVKKCEEFGSTSVMIERGNCKIPICKGKEEMNRRRFCKPPTIEEKEQIHKDCKNKDGMIIRGIGSDGCPRPECITKGECRRESDIPAEAYDKCKADGGKLVVKSNDEGCIKHMNCVKRGDRNIEIDYVDEVPDSIKLIQLALKLEKTKILLEELSTKIADIAAYYEETGNTAEAERFEKVAAVFAAAQTRIEEIKAKMRDEAKDMTREELIDIKKDIKYLTDVTLQDVLFVMLGGEAVMGEEGAEIVSIDEAVECENDDSCFQEAVDLCKVGSTFKPEKIVDVKIDSFDKENKKCVIYAKGSPVPMPDEEMAQYMPEEVKKYAGKEVEMKCNIPMGLGISIMTGPEAIIQYCEGSMAEMIKEIGVGGGPEMGPSIEETMETRPIMGEGKSPMENCMMGCIGADVICEPGSANPKCSECEDKCEELTFGRKGMTMEEEVNIREQEMKRDEMQRREMEGRPSGGLGEFNEGLGDKMDQIGNDIQYMGGYVVLKLRGEI